MSEQTTMEMNAIVTKHFSSSYHILNYMRWNKTLCDVQIEIGDRKISAHKNVLASYSEYFYKMFTGDFKDNLLDLNTNEKLTPNSLELLIDFMYTSQLTIDDSNVKELLIASNFLLLGDVKEECLKYIKNQINIDNFMMFKDTDCLNDLFLSFVLNNFNNVVESNSFLSFSFELMMELIQSDELCADEEKVYESVMLWLKHDLEDRLKYLPELMKSIRLGLISIDYLNNTVQKEDLIKSNVKCMNYLCEAYKVQSHISMGEEEILDCNQKHRKFKQKLQNLKISENEDFKDNTTKNVLYMNNSEEIKSLKFEQIMELIKSDNLYSDETQVYEATIFWVYQDVENRYELLPQLLQAVRLPSIPVKYLVEIIEAEKLINSNPKCMSLLFNAYKIHALKNAGLSIFASSICNYKYRNSGKILIIKYGSSTYATLEWFNIIDNTLYPSTLRWTELMSSIILNDGRIFSLKMIGLFSRSKCYASIYNGDVKKWEDTIYSNFYHGRLFTQYNYSSIVQFYDRVYVMSYAGVEYYDLIKRSWNVVNFKISKDTKEVKLAVVSDLIYVITDLRCFYYDPKTDVGQLIHPMSTPLVGYSTCSLNNQLYVIGGEILNEKTLSFKCIPLTLVLKYDSQYHTWVSVANMNIPRYNAGVVAINGKIYVIGGRENDTIEYYDPQTDKWTISEKKLTMPKYKTSAFVLGVQANIHTKNILNYYS